MRSIVFLLALSGALSPAGGPGADAAKKALAELEGTWVLESEHTGGRPAPKENATLTIKGNQWTLTREGKDYKATITVDPTKKPRTFDRTFKTDGGSVERMGIYKLEGNTLTIAGAAGERPTTFDVKARTKANISIFKRAKK